MSPSPFHPFFRMQRVSISHPQIPSPSPLLRSCLCPSGPAHLASSFAATLASEAGSPSPSHTNLHIKSRQNTEDLPHSTMCLIDKLSFCGDSCKATRVLRNTLQERTSQTETQSQLVLRTPRAAASSGSCTDDGARVARKGLPDREGGPCTPEERMRAP